MDVIVLIWVWLSHFSIVNYPKSMECLFKLEVWEGMTQHAKPKFSHQIHTLYYLLPKNWYVSCFSQTAGVTFWLRLTLNTLFLNWSKYHYLWCYSISCLIFTWQVGGAYQLTRHMTKTLQHGLSLLSDSQLSHKQIAQFMEFGVG